jgi:hypothetical protein
LANKLAQEIAKILSEEVGEFVANATVKKNCELINTTPDALTVEQLPALAEKIEKSVTFFSGKETGGQLIEKITALRVQEGPPSKH